MLPPYLINLLLTCWLVDALVAIFETSNERISALESQVASKDAEIVAKAA